MKTKNKKIKTFTGKLVDPMAMTPDDVDIVDIAHALSNECRYAGHCEKFFSVAAHSLNVARDVWLQTQDIESTFIALLHDASEAYLKDMPTPVKWRMKNYIAAEQRLLKVIARKFNIKSFIKGYVKDSDRHELLAEQAGFRESLATPAEIEDAFLRTFYYLQKRREEPDVTPMVRRDVTKILWGHAFPKMVVRSGLQD